VTLLCRPKGRGNWTVIPMVLPTTHADFFAFRKGMTVTIDTRVLRIVKVQP
jgi:hypothetical protein